MKISLELVSVSSKPLFELSVVLPCDDLYRMTGLNEDELDGWYVTECHSSNCVDISQSVIDVYKVNKAVMEYNRLLAWEQELVLDLYYSSVERDFEAFNSALWDYVHYEVFLEPQLKRTKILAGQYFLNALSSEIAEKVCIDKTLDEETALKFFYIGIASGKIQYVDRNVKRYLVQDEYIVPIPNKITYKFIEKSENNIMGE